MKPRRERPADVPEPPEDLVAMARIIGAFGVKGWVKLQAYGSDPENLLDYPVWWLSGSEGWTPQRVESAEIHAGAVAAKLAGCDDRDTATLYRGHEIAVSRAQFPEPAANEYYWTDLIGLSVVNRQGEDLGKVARIFETGANDVLVVEGDRERLIPFTEEVVQTVDFAADVIRVDWGADF